ncbi:hypothetical protein PMI22_01315 [Pseudomonas sp. GM21]|nr:hypothetical protein PMI22_01315 [Pseudomonas sp. GM21]
MTNLTPIATLRCVGKKAERITIAATYSTGMVGDRLPGSSAQRPTPQCSPAQRLSNLR